ncbi:MAG: 2-oxoglutarate ferredoxin oxidoreductase subunit alpha [Steroidobacteraceae bacterium]|nr:2-oxoglutarate ferredoxin oxidoreductase subunit alpha [Steroidobacteraceae bacterium]
MNQDRTNDFAIKIATVNGTGSASANTLLMKSIFRSGIPVMERRLPHLRQHLAAAGLAGAR